MSKLKVFSSMILTTIFSFFISQTVFAAPELVPLPKGIFSYQEHFIVHKIRNTEILNHNSDDGKNRMNELKKQGFKCLRNKPETTKCWIDKSLEQQLPELANTIRNAIENMIIQFPLEYKMIDKPYDGSTTQEWIVRDKYFLNQRELNLFTVVHNNSEQWYLTFPVDSEQPIGLLNYLNDQKLGITMIANSQNQNKIKSYFIEAYLEGK